MIPAAGTEMPPLTAALDLPALVAYAGATWDWHRLHYDPGYAAGQGLPGPAVDGQLLGALLARALREWLGPEAALRRMSFRFARPVFAGETVRCAGSVSAVDGVLLSVELRVEVVGPGGAVVRTAVAPASAKVEVPADPPNEARAGVTA